DIGAADGRAGLIAYNSSNVSGNFLCQSEGGNNDKHCNEQALYEHHILPTDLSESAKWLAPSLDPSDLSLYSNGSQTRLQMRMHGFPTFWLTYVSWYTKLGSRIPDFGVQ